jgi:hypothetical protein
MNKELTCQQRISEHLTSRLQDIETCNNTEDPEVRDGLQQELCEGVLSVDITKTYTILLSTGGPEDGFKITVNQDNEYVSGTYFFKDWFDGAESNLSDAESQAVCDMYGLYNVEF